MSMLTVSTTTTLCATSTLTLLLLRALPSTPSDEVLDAVDELEVRAEDLELLQDERGLAFKIALEPGLVGLVEAWASGVEWRRLMGGTSLDPGDVYRILRRTLELLRQVSLVPYVSEGVARRAREALRAMDRYPLADNAILGAAADGAAEQAPGQVEPQL